MCGIVGYTGTRPAQERLLEGLAALEYRGYDSAGIALCRDDGPIERIRSVGNLAALRSRLPALAGGAGHEPGAGIGHTRWATHGAVSEANAHPHAAPDGRVQIVLNGIVENWRELRDALGAELASETDAEVVAHLVAASYDGDLGAALERAARRLRGQCAVVAVAADEPGTIAAVRRRTPLVVGLGDGEQFIASAVAAFAAHTRRVVELRDDEVVVLTPEGVSGAGGPVVTAAADHVVPDRGGFDSFMRKEIAEQPAAVAETVFELLGRTPRIDGPVRIVACGSSYHAGLAARDAFAVPVEVDVASEYRYRKVVGSPQELVIGITQSGETADTLAAIRAARASGCRVLALTNVADSQAARDADAVVLTRAGTEVGVAATKTFTTQVAALLALAQQDVGALPDLLEQTIAAAEPWAAALAPVVADAPLAMYLGRGAGAAIAAEGALKLKEVAYVPADAYAAGEMKHGPIALLSRETPVLCVATAGPAREKLHSNMAEVRARGVRVHAVAGDGDAAAHADDVVRLPEAPAALQALLAVVPLQLLAYHAAAARGLDVDQPRNLAKTVTVE
jgi:glucosamine--fructose-6-phosphate aminotransferase (isomerizing)